MAVHSEQSTGVHSRSLIGGPVFDWVFMIVGLWFITGAFLDAWAHNHIPQLEDFFTPWHGVLYSGFFATALTLVFTVLINRFRSKVSWREAVPDGYGLSLLGTLGFVIGGIGDGFWHVLFGIEKNIDAQFSPTHMLLLVCTCLFLSGPYRALYRRSDSVPGWRALLAPALILMFVIIGLNTMVAHPFTFLWPTNTPKSDETGQTLAVIGILFQTTILTGVLLYTIRRWKLYFGFFTIVFTLNAIPMSFMQDHTIVILIAALAGVLTDILYQVLRPSLEREGAFRLFALLAAGSYYLVYFLVLLIAYGTVWSVHLIVGTIVVSALIGGIMSYLVIPSRGPIEESTES